MKLHQETKLDGARKEEASVPILTLGIQTKLDSAFGGWAGDGCSTLVVLQFAGTRGETQDGEGGATCRPARQLPSS